MAQFPKIVSGGQTGADRAALVFAADHGLPHGGWCPKGRLAEDGRISDRFDLKETPDTSYIRRTEWNVRDSDGTVIFSLATQLSGGSAATQGFTKKWSRPCLHLCLAVTTPENAATRLEQFIKDNQITVLNVAGPRASSEAEIAIHVLAALNCWRNAILIDNQK